MKPLAAVLVLTLAAAGERQWQTGTWQSAGAKFDVYTSVPPRSGNVIGASSEDSRPQVGVYVIDTDTQRITIQDIVPIGSSCIEREFKVGGAVTFALDKTTAYVRCQDEPEHRLRLTRKVTKPAK